LNGSFLRNADFSNKANTALPITTVVEKVTPAIVKTHQGWSKEFGMPFRFPASMALLLTAGCAPVMAQVTFRGFGSPLAAISGMSADGSVIVGTVPGVPPTTEGFRWTAATGLVRIGGAEATAISRDGKTIVGTVRDELLRGIASIWISGREWKQLGGVPGGRPDLITGLLSIPYGVSSDGSVIVGAAWDANFRTVGFRWDEKTGMVNLGPQGKGIQQSARAVSANGSVIVGFDKDNYAVNVPNAWRGYVHYDGGLHLLHAFGWAGEATRTNDVASIIVGQGPPINSTAPHGGTTYMYTAWDGNFQDLGAVWVGSPGINLEEYQSKPFGVSDDGTVVVGQTGGVNTQFAMIWTPETGMLYMHDYLTRNGVTAHQNWVLTESDYVSPNGKVIAGAGRNPQGVPESWIVTLP